jgi:CheY-like chemotaxis protein
VLVAEDNPVNQRVIARMLELLGYAVDLASDGHEAAMAACDSRYACILMDCQMPGLDGFGATRAIRAREPAGQRVPIVAVTANAMASDRARCIEVGMDDFLAKPVELEVLRGTLARRARR